MQKLPPLEKIPEAYSAIEDKRIELFDNYALVKSSDNKKEYLIKWHNNIYYSNDNATYWQGYPGYPIIAVLMLQSKISFNKDISKYFKKINWHKLNKETNRDYQKSLTNILNNISQEEKDRIYDECQKVYEELSNLEIELTRKKNLTD